MPARPSDPPGRVAVLYADDVLLAAALAGRLAADGMDVALLGADPHDAELVGEHVASSGRRSRAMTTDLTSGESVSKTLLRVAGDLGPPTVLVACLGHGGRAPEAELRIAFLLAREALEHMIEQWWGRILLMPSTGAGRVLGHAVSGFVKTLALECGVFGVTANSVEVASDSSHDPSFCEGAAHAVSFLAGKNASFVSGQVIRIDRPTEM